MSEAPRQPVSGFSLRDLLRPGESVVAPLGMAIFIVFVAQFSALLWWTTHTQNRVALDHQQQTLINRARLVQRAITPILANDDLSAARNFIGTLSSDEMQLDCRLTLADGRVLADSDPARITAMALPASTEVLSSVVQSETIVRRGDATVIQQPIPLSSGHRATLEVSYLPQLGSSAHGLPTPSNLRDGMALIAVVTLTAVLILYRYARNRLRGPSAIVESLRVAHRGVQDASVLRVSANLGEEAIAWNAILSERSALQREVAKRQILDQPLTSTRHAGEAEDACDALWIGLLVVDQNKAISYANGAAAILLSTASDDLINQPVTDSFNNTETQSAISEVLSGTSARSTTYVHSDTDSAHGHLRVDIRPLRQGSRLSALVVIEDVTQAKVAETARNGFVAQATHELRSPLTNIRMYVETAIEDGEDDPAIRGRCLNVINQEVRRLERIVTDMLSVSELEAGSMQLVSDDIRLDALFEELQHEYQPFATDKSIELVFDLPPKLPVIQGDRDKLLLALHNLIGNALKYTPDGGKVIVGVEAADDGISIEVVDTGFGIDSGELDEIFNRFHRAPDPRLAGIAGSGLGLTLARDMISLHRGTIEVESELNKGSTFRVTLPTLKAA